MQRIFTALFRKPLKLRPVTWSTG